jgi:hypothetical protein
MSLAHEEAAPRPAAVEPTGPFMDVFLHEAGHATFSILQISLFGGEEDAADQFSAYICCD